MFDNSKIKRAVPGWSADIPYHRGAEEVLNWYLEDPARQKTDPAINALMDRMIAAVEGITPKTR